MRSGDSAGAAAVANADLAGAYDATVSASDTFNIGATS
jgi:hypothetical protein